MGELISVSAPIIKLAESMVARQILREGDYYDENGILICGTCGEPRREIMDFPCGTKDEPDRKVSTQVTRKCKCDRDESERSDARRRAQQTECLRNRSGIPYNLKNIKFDDLEITDGNRESIEACKTYVEQFDKMWHEGKGLVLTGNVGTGKSCAAACIANALLEQQVSVVWMTTSEFLRKAQSDYNDESEIISSLESVGLVIIDDYGVERNTEFALEKIYNLIDGRYQSGKPMIVTTNFEFDRLANDEEVRSRTNDRILKSCYELEFQGDSWRKKEHLKRLNQPIEEFFGIEPNEPQHDESEEENL